MIKAILNSFKFLHVTSQMRKAKFASNQDLIRQINEGTVKLRLASLTRYQIDSEKR